MVFAIPQDGWSSCKEVTLEDMASDEQYDPDTVYGMASTLVFSQQSVCMCTWLLHAHETLEGAILLGSPQGPTTLFQ